MKSGKAPFISDDELTVVLSHLKGKHALRNRTILLFSHYLGLRAKELAALHLTDVYDLHRKQHKTTIRLLGAYTKGNKYREIFLLNNQAIESLISYIEETHHGLISSSSPLFLSQKGNFFSANTMQRMISNCYKMANINASSHSGRRSFATRLIRKNVDIYSIKQLMGHSSISTTQEYFSSDPNTLMSQLIKINQ